ncbi:MAG TPA: PAS domain-containing protein [Rhizomicrobium sp.]|jgi:hypothetical protein
MPRSPGETGGDDPDNELFRDAAQPASPEPLPELLAVHFHTGPIAAAPLHPNLKTLLAFWSAKCRGERPPARADLPVYELKPWLGHLAILEPAPGTFRFRLGGTDLIPRFGRETTGLTLADIPPALRKPLAAMLDIASSRQAPLAAATAIRHRGRRTLWSELMLPLAAGRAGPALLLLAAYPMEVGPGMP